MNAIAAATDETNSQRVSLPPLEIRTDGGTQCRVKINQEVVLKYAEAKRRGDSFPPLIVFYDGKNYWLADGFHRIAADIILGIDSEVEVRPGTLDDAILYSVGTNPALGRTNKDQRRAVLILIKFLGEKGWLSSEVDAGKKEWSNRKIAGQCRVTEGLIRKMLKELQAAYSTQSWDKVAQKCGVEPAFAKQVAGYLRESKRFSEYGSDETKPESASTTISTPAEVQQDEDLEESEENLSGSESSSSKATSVAMAGNSEPECSKDPGFHCSEKGVHDSVHDFNQGGSPGHLQNPGISRSDSLPSVPTGERDIVKEVLGLAEAIAPFGEDPLAWLKQILQDWQETGVNHNTPSTNQKVKLDTEQELSVLEELKLQVSSLTQQIQKLQAENQQLQNALSFYSLANSNINQQSF